jgi:hypothetical protein
MDSNVPKMRSATPLKDEARCQSTSMRSLRYVAPNRSIINEKRGALNQYRDIENVAIGPEPLESFEAADEAPSKSMKPKIGVLTSKISAFKLVRLALLVQNCMTNSLNSCDAAAATLERLV